MVKVMCLHEAVPGVEGSEVSLVRGSYQYYHYNCDGTEDQGWGCGYRTLQTLLSWLQLNTTTGPCSVPSLPVIQHTLYTIGDKPAEFVGSHDWIGSVEAGLVVDQLTGLPCQILHARSGSELASLVPQLEQHFRLTGCPAMMGGDRDCSAKGVFGSATTPTSQHLLILDPHFIAPAGRLVSNQELVQQGWAKWVDIQSFDASSFYNLCLPQVRIKCAS